MKTKHPLLVFVLVMLLLFQVLSALVGFYMMLIAPKGSAIRIPLSLLENSPFSSFLIPGLILLLFLGFFPGITLYGLLKVPDWKWCEKLNIYKDKKWPWTFSLYFGIILICWIIVEEALIGGGHLLQTVYCSLGVFILIATLLPKMMKFYSR